MAEIHLTQAEADVLMAVPKVRIDDIVWNYPLFGGTISVPLASGDKENFLLDISRSQIDLFKGKYQNRGRQVVVLIRLDFGGAPHRNPDGAEVRVHTCICTGKGMGTNGQLPLPADLFSDTADGMNLLDAFMRYCKIIEPPIIQRGLFS